MTFLLHYYRIVHRDTLIDYAISESDLLAITNDKRLEDTNIIEAINHALRNKDVVIPIEENLNVIPVMDCPPYIKHFHYIIAVRGEY